MYGQKAEWYNTFGEMDFFMSYTLLSESLDIGQDSGVPVHMKTCLHLISRNEDFYSFQEKKIFENTAKFD